MAPAAIQWRAKGGLQEVKATVRHEDKQGCTISIPTRIYLPCKIFCQSPKAEQVRVHIFSKAAKIWKAQYKGAELAYRVFPCDTAVSVASLIEKALSKTGRTSLHPWAVTEVIEVGDGGWKKGTTITYASDKAADTLASFGWTAARGKDAPPVWLNMHKTK